MINLLTSEIELIQDSALREFVAEGLSMTTATYNQESKLAEETKKFLAYARAICLTLGVDDRPLDMITVACLLHGIAKYTEDGELDVFHPFMVRRAMFSNQSLIGRDMFDNIMIMIEGYQGFDSVIPQVIPDVKDSVYLWILPLAYGLTKNLE